MRRRQRRVQLVYSCSQAHQERAGQPNRYPTEQARRRKPAGFFTSGIPGFGRFFGLTVEVMFYDDVCSGVTIRPRAGW